MPQPAWTHTGEQRAEIEGDGGERQLILHETVARRNHAGFWFDTNENGKTQFGNQFVIDEIGITTEVVIDFDLTVVYARSRT